METCSVCDKPQAEYTCKQCEEYVCEDCCAAMTYHNQIDYTCCHNCKPDEPTMGDCNKPSKPKIMEYLTELKVGMELPIAVIIAWSKNQTFDSNNPVRTIQSIKSKSFNVRGISTMRLELPGFIEFYNKFYNLTPKVMSRIEDWHNCVFYYNTTAQAEEISKLLVKIGFKSQSNSGIGYIRADKTGCVLSCGHELGGWKPYLKNLREFEPEEAIAALSGISTQSLPEINLNNLTNVRFSPANKEEQDKLLTRLFELGYTLNEAAKLWDVHLTTWSIHSACNITGSNSSSKEGYKLMTYEQLFPKSRINTNNHINTKTDGNQINLRKAQVTITGGQRPQGITVRGKASRIAITSGHLSYRAINY